MEKVLTPKQMTAARLLADGLKGCDVAEQIEIDQATLSRWRKKPGFQQAIAVQQTILGDELHTQLPTAVNEAVATLRDIVNNPKAKNSDRIRAALSVLALAGYSRNCPIAPLADGRVGQDEAVLRLEQDELAEEIDIDSPLPPIRFTSEDFRHLQRYSPVPLQGDRASSSRY